MQLFWSLENQTKKSIIGLLWAIQLPDVSDNQMPTVFRCHSKFGPFSIRQFSPFEKQTSPVFRSPLYLKTWPFSTFKYRTSRYSDPHCIWVWNRNKPASHFSDWDSDTEERVVSCRVIGQQEPDFFQLDQLPDGTIAHAQVRQQLQRLGYDLFGVAPVFEIGDAAKGW